ncbi:hypothetical protein XfCFBP8082_00610 [Xylella fastidiosa subsp. fastidiosa]|jgi:hypothetical protein|uniref:Uncharacterized protein n=1 Tax=Xylella fastidiosa (strain M23) TaxID=405441 RepID=B2I905_XYLF2|nr:hypothetical protein XfasM23_0538 [Xylella fastidiosa M23]EGO82976.1 hypothetical protein XFEB_00149 [Xylella fastidiosa EB92.1]NBI38254.1 hypothetical protein [Xylella fastidiosa subsp. fastidiosa]QIS25257.1 hypothetical protein F7G16_02850 [Xylella fastidiosa]RUA38684.1 hypothetical protein DX877_02795 [Xylella fastidiosa subsp. fastidiosa]
MESTVYDHFLDYCDYHLRRYVSLWTPGPVHSAPTSKCNSRGDKQYSPTPPLSQVKHLETTAHHMLIQQALLLMRFISAMPI